MEPIEAKRESTVKDFLEVLFRRKWIVIGIVGVATAVVIIMTLKQPAVYESTAKVLIKRGEMQGVFDRNVRVLNWEEEIASQIEMVKSQTVASRAQAMVSQFYPKGYATDRKIVLDRINSGVVSTSNVIWVTYTSGDPVFCEAAINAIVNAYREYYTNTRTPPEMDDFFSQEIDRLQEELEYWREHKEKVLRDGNIVDIEDQRRNLLERISNYETELDDIVRQRKEKEAVIAQLDSLLGADLEDLAAVASDLTDSQLEVDLMKDLRIKLQLLMMKESELGGRYTDKNMEIQRIRKQIEDMRQMVLSEIRTQIILNRSKLAIIVQREEMLRGLLAKLEIDRSRYPAKEIELDRIDLAIDKLGKMYENVITQQMEAKISRASNPEWTVTILNPASPAYRKKTRDYVRMALGPAFSLIIALGLAFFIDSLDHSIKNINEAEENLGISVLGSFPETNRK
jgi:succinoglycan biosynthesis transport protein ExoP